MLVLIMSLLVPQSSYASEADVVVKQFQAQSLAFIADRHHFFVSRRLVEKRFKKLKFLVSESSESRRLKRRGYEFMSIKGQEALVIDNDSWKEGPIARLSIVTNVVKSLDADERQPSELDMMELQEQMEQNLQSNMENR